MGKILLKEWNTNLGLRILSITSVLLIIASLLLPPTGIIDPSVLAGVGEIEGFGIILIISKAIDKGVSVKASKGDSSIEVENSNDKD